MIIIIIIIIIIIKPGFHLIVQIVPMALAVSKNFQTIRTTGTIGSFPYDRLDRLKGKRRGVVSDVSGWDKIIFPRVSQTSQTKWWLLLLFGERTSCLAIGSFSRFCVSDVENLMSWTFSNFNCLQESYARKIGIESVLNTWVRGIIGGIMSTNLKV